MSHHHRLRITALTFFSMLPIACGDGEGRPSDEGITSIGEEIGTSESATAETGNDQSTEGAMKFDFGNQGDVPLVNDCSGGGGGMGEVEFSYIWLATSPESPSSKIDTMTMLEEGRYLTRPDSAGNPSRTSVSLSGAVAVANRAGGITKVIAEPVKCDEMANGVPGPPAGLQPGDPLARSSAFCGAGNPPVVHNFSLTYSHSPSGFWTTSAGAQAKGRWRS